MLQLFAHSLVYRGDVKVGRCLVPKRVPRCWALCQLAWWLRLTCWILVPCLTLIIFFHSESLRDLDCFYSFFFSSQDWLLSKMLSSNLALYLLSPKKMHMGSFHLKNLWLIPSCLGDGPTQPICNKFSSSFLLRS